MIYKYYGPPGTGKTYKLISRAKAYVRMGVPLDKIAYFAFTKKAAEEARERMPAEDKDLYYFRTIHSFAFDQLDLNTKKVMQGSDYEKIGKKLNLRVKYYDKYNKEEIFYLNSDSPYFQMIGKAINRDVTIREEYDRNEHNSKEIKWHILKNINDNLKNYKTVKKKLDFNDMINQLLLKEDLPRFKAIFIDEAQDLSPLQWKLYDILKAKTKDIYLAGDDDQAIFEWAGADVKRFIQEPAKERVLNRSKRISKAVQAQSTIPISNIVGIRKLKKYYPRDEKGICEDIYNLDEIDLTKNKWFILTRTVSKLLKIHKMLIDKGLYFESNRGKSIKIRMYNAMNNYNSWCKGKELAEEEIKDIKDFTGLKEYKWKPDKTGFKLLN
jgi:DNA helicase-2/ATP-dependent DNA helicase PcrA